MTTIAPAESPKETIRRPIEQQPEDATAEELLREIAYAAMIQRGLADIDTGRVVADDEFRRWVDSRSA